MDPGGLELRKRLVKCLRDWKHLQGRLRNRYSHLVNMRLAHAVIALERLCAQMRDRRIAVNAKTAAWLNKAKGELERMVNASLKEKLADPNFHADEPHYKRYLRALKAALAEPRVANFTIGTGHWKVHPKHREHLPKAEEALRVSKLHAASVIATAAVEKLLGSLKGGDLDVVFHGLTSSRFSPLPRLARKIVELIPSPKPEAGDRRRRGGSSGAGNDPLPPPEGGEELIPKREHLKHKIRLGNPFTNPATNKTPDFCLTCGKPYSSAQVFKLHVRATVLGRTYEGTANRHVRRPDGASTCCARTPGQDDQKSSPTSSPHIPRLGTLVVQELLKAREASGKAARARAT